MFNWTCPECGLPLTSTLEPLDEIEKFCSRCVFDAVKCHILRDFTPEPVPNGAFPSGVELGVITATMQNGETKLDWVRC